LIQEFHYRMQRRSHGEHAGRHAGSTGSGGFEFHGLAPFMAHPDARHLDVRATLADPFGQPVVRQFRQRVAVPVYVLADLSASMGFAGKMRLLADFAASAAYSAFRSGDPFGFFGCDTALSPDWILPLRWHKGLAEELEARLRNFQPQGANAHALLETAVHLGKRRALVFLVSDFHFPSGELEALLDAFAPHDLVPVVLWNSAEYERLPAWGFAELRDPETGARRRLFVRPSLRERIRETFAARRTVLVNLFGRFGREAFFLVDRFEADALTRYFYQA